MSLLPNPYKPLPWPEFVKRNDVRNLPIHEQKRIYLKEQLYFENFLSAQLYLQSSTLNSLNSTNHAGGPNPTVSSGPYVFGDRSELDLAISEWISDEASAIATYGQINTWDVTAVRI